VYSSNATTEFKFDRYYNKSAIDLAIAAIVFPGESTRTGSGLTTVRNDLFANGRNGIPNFLVVVTDGVAIDEITLPSVFLRATDVYILAVGIGNFYARPQLDDMASDPDAFYVFEASTYDILPSTATKIKQRICQGNVPLFHVRECSSSFSSHTSERGDHRLVKSADLRCFLDATMIHLLPVTLSYEFEQKIHSCLPCGLS